MGPIFPIQPSGASPLSSRRAKGSTQSEITAAKVHKMGLPIVPSKKASLQGRPVTVLQEATELSQRIRSDWDQLAPEELAEKIIELENKVSRVKEPSAALDKVKKTAEHLHFRFVFPIAMEIETAEKAISANFAKTVYKAAGDVFKTQTLTAFTDLSQVQKREILRYAVGGQS